MKLKKQLSVLALSAIILISGCATVEPVYIPVPPRPELPKIGADYIYAEDDSYICYTADGYTELVRRDTLQSTYIDRLINLIDIANGDAASAHKDAK